MPGGEIKKRGFNFENRKQVYSISNIFTKTEFSSLINGIIQAVINSLIHVFIQAEIRL